ncbi:MAG: VPLPA-CTERM-specific exosortase XrtD [Methylococcales bacterium]
MNLYINKMPVTLASILASCAIIVWAFYDALVSMVNYWHGHEEFGHAFLLPFISIYLIWQIRGEFGSLSIKKPWLGLLVAVIGVGLFVISDLGAVYTLQQYAFVMLIIGLFMSMFGVDITKKAFMPLLLLFFMIPLPGFLYNTLSGQLQLISSQIGVYIIRLFDISVYLEGNVIDLGVYKLQVVEACSGLRYLFPLMTLGFIVSYIYKSSYLNRTIIFLSTIPITVLMNSFRIGMIGVLVEFYGISMAEGFLHDFEGWIIFMACLVVLLGEMWVLNKVSKGSATFSEMFNFDLIEGTISDQEKPPIKISLYAVWILPLILSGVLIVSSIKEVKQIELDRLSFEQFPTEISGYSGKREFFSTDIIGALNFDDYISSNYSKENLSYNVYIAYYDTQNVDKVPHSPKACLPGGGWLITNSSVVTFNDVNDSIIRANRVVINQRGVKQLVYYWFKQRDRIITSEYLVKWYLLVDSIAKNRTDGALVRFVASMEAGESLESAEKRLRDFVGRVNPLIVQYVPD